MNVDERMEIVRHLCSFEGRLAGTDAERRAADDLGGLLERLGRRADAEPTYVHPEYALIHAVHLLLAIGGSVASVFAPPVGFAMVLLAAVSMYGDVNARWYLIRRLFFRRASQNVVSPGPRPDAPARLILSAHYDAAKTGAAFRPKSVERAARLQAQLPFAIGPFRILFWSIAALLPILGARMAGLEANWVSLVQLVPTAVLIVSVVPLIDIALSEVAPGANNNASGVATVISLADELDRDPPQNLDVWVLLTGAEECLMEGMRGFVRAHRKDLDRDRTYFVNVDAVGHGTLRYEAAGGFVVTYQMDPRLVALCDAIAQADREDGNRYGAQPLRHGMATNALPPRLAGYPAINISCLNELNIVPNYHTPDDTPDNLDPEAMERAHGFLLELVRVLDRDVSRRGAGR
jgi:peptidase M28-like protein